MKDRDLPGGDAPDAVTVSSLICQRSPAGITEGDALQLRGSLGDLSD